MVTKLLSSGCPPKRGTRHYSASPVNRRRDWTLLLSSPTQPPYHSTRSYRHATTSPSDQGTKDPLGHCLADSRRPRLPKRNERCIRCAVTSTNKSIIISQPYVGDTSAQMKSSSYGLLNSSIRSNRPVKPSAKSMEFG